MLSFCCLYIICAHHHRHMCLKATRLQIMRNMMGLWSESCLNKWWVLACEVWSVYIRKWAIFLAFRLQQLFGRNRNVSLTVLGLLFTEGVGNERKVWLILTIDVLVLLTLSKVEPGTTVMTLGNRLIRIYVNYNNCCLINNYDLLINDAPTYC